jgi:hypothetical protein
MSSIITITLMILFCSHYSLFLVHGVPSSILNTSESSSSLENKQHVEVSPHSDFHVLIDSGSTGSRVYIYQYEEGDPLQTLVEIAHKRVRPALSTFYKDYRGLKKQLRELIIFAESYVLESKRSKTSLSLQATAGLRIMPIHEQEWLVSHARTILGNSSFAVDPFETRVLTGGEEALFGLLATNAAFGDLSLHSAQGLLLGAADLGGSSQQIAFMLPRQTFSLKNIWKQLSWSMLFGNWPQPYPNQCKPDYRLAVNGSKQYLEVFARSVPALGLVEAMRDSLYEMAEQYLDSKPQSSQKINTEDLTKTTDTINHEVDIEDSSIPVTTVVSNSGDVGDILVTAIEQDMTIAHGESGIQFAIHDPEQLDRSVEDIHFVNISFQTADSAKTVVPLYNPCVGIGERYPYPDDLDMLPWVGTGDFHECVRIVKEKLNMKASSEMSCLRSLSRRSGDGSIVMSSLPTIVAMDNFPKVLEVLKLANDSTVSPAAIKEAGIKICQRSWTDILSDFPGFFPFRAHQACFGASYIYAITTELYGLDDNDTKSFFPTDNHHSYTVGWPLGSTIYSAMKWTFEEMNSHPSPLL